MIAAVWLIAVLLSVPLAVLTAAAVSGFTRSTRADLHWSERARARWTGRSAVWIAGLGATACAAVLGVSVLSEAGLASPVVGGAASGAVALSGALLAARLLRRGASRPAPTLRARLGGFLARGLLLSALLPLLVTLAVAPFEWGPRVFVAVAAGALTWTWQVTGGATDVLRLLRVASAAEPALRDRVVRICRQAGREPRRVLVVEATLANAAVLPHPGDVVVFRPMLDALTEPEVDAVLAHEAGHMAEPRRAAWLRAVPGYAALVLGILPALIDAVGLVALPAAFAVAIGAGLWARRRARTLECHADAHAHESDPVVFARALEALYRTNGVPAVLGGRSTHPDLYDRLLAAGVEPDFPRPAAPSRGRALLGIAAATLVIIVFDVAGALGVMFLARNPGGAPRSHEPVDLRGPR